MVKKNKTNTKNKIQTKVIQNKKNKEKVKNTSIKPKIEQPKIEQSKIEKKEKIEIKNLIETLEQSGNKKNYKTIIDKILIGIAIAQLAYIIYYFLI